MLKPRWAINVYGIGGLVFLLVGPGLMVLSTTLPEEAGWLVYMGAGFALIGVVWTGLAGRMGRLKDSKKLAQSGTRCTALVRNVKATGATTRQGEHGPVISQVYRLDLEVQSPTGPYEVRVYRSLRGNQMFAVNTVRELPVAVDPDNQRKLAILWDEVMPAGGGNITDMVGQALAQAGVQFQQMQQQFSAGTAVAAPPAAGQRLWARITSSTPAGYASDGRPVVQVVVEYQDPATAAARFAQGVVAGPANGAGIAAGQQVVANLDATGTGLVSVEW